MGLAFGPLLLSWRSRNRATLRPGGGIGGRETDLQRLTPTVAETDRGIGRGIGIGRETGRETETETERDTRTATATGTQTETGTLAGRGTEAGTETESETPMEMAMVVQTEARVLEEELWNVQLEVFCALLVPASPSLFVSLSLSPSASLSPFSRSVSLLAASLSRPRPLVRQRVLQRT